MTIPTPTICEGPIYLPGGVDKDGKRTWKVRFQVSADTHFGPSTARLTTGLPQYGDVWKFEDDVDYWAYCTPEVAVAPMTNPPVNRYSLEYTFVTAGGIGSCADSQQQANPLQLPNEISIHWEKYTQEAVIDRWGNFLETSSHEQMTGPQVEYDEGRTVVEITKNLLDPQLALLTVLNNTVNSVTMWGLPPRWIKMTVDSLTQKQYGNCYRYYVRKLRFEARNGGWDRWIRDVGTKCIDGEWEKSSANQWEWIVNEPVDRTRPSDFIRFKDPQGVATKCVLDGAGAPFVPEEVDDVTDCDFCNEGGGPRIRDLAFAPAEWRLLNIFSANGRAIILGAVGGGCEWIGLDEEGNNWELTGSDAVGTGDPEWVLTVNGGSITIDPNGGGTWNLLTGLLNCGGLNTLTSDAYSGTPVQWQLDAVIAPNSAETLATEDCDLCGDSPTYIKRPTKFGAPSIWRVQELYTAGGETIKLTHTTGCNWTVTDIANTYLLELVPAVDDAPTYWRLTVNGGTDAEWRLDDWNWECRGPNRMKVFAALADADPPWPDQVTLVAGNQPGFRRVEFYGEADLVTILGLPATL